MSDRPTVRKIDRPMRGPPGTGAYEKPKDPGRVLGRLLGYLQRKKWALLAVIVLVLVSTTTNLTGNYMLKPLINDYILPGDFRGLAQRLVILLGIYLVGVAASYGQSRLMVYVAQSTSNTLRRDLFVRLQSLPLTYFDAHPHGELMSRFTNDIDNVQLAFEQSLVQLVSGSLNLVGAVLLMGLLSPLLLLVTLTMLTLMSLLLSKLTGLSRRYFEQQQKHLGDLNGYIEELVEGLKVVKVFGHEPAAIVEFQKRNEQYRQAALKANFYAGVSFPVVGNMSHMSYAATAVAGGLLVLAGRFDVGSLAAYLQYTRQVGMPVQFITQQMNMLLAALAGAERVFEVMDQEPEVDAGEVDLVGVQRRDDGSIEVMTDGEHPTHWAWRCPQPDGTVQYTELKGDLRFHDVTFGYAAGTPVLKDISLYAKPGQKIAFVGSTGAGKTTVTNLINRFYEVDQGQITFDGIDIRRIHKDSLRESIGMVLQDTHLFTGTVMENIRYGRLDATDQECITAAHQANAHSFIKRLPEGFETEITADGANLSQGQRQLLAIARAAAADPPVLVLDEATSSIDTRTERLIEKGLDALMADRTVFVIAHRLSTVRNADAIIVIENGEIIERGSHEDLLAQKGRYYRLYTGQYELE